MDFDQAKTLRLQRWRSTLDDQEFRMQAPEAHRQTLREMSAAMQAEGLIDLMQQFDMDDMADAAYWHAVEELQNSPARYRGASSYEVVLRGSGESWGTIRRSIFCYANDEPRGLSFPYDGKVYSDEEGVHLILCLSRKLGKISGLTLEMSEQKFELIEVERMIGGIARQPICEADIYRGLVDIAQVALEERNLTIFEKIRPHIESAAFIICPACQDRFGAREDCSSCSGHGFLPKPKTIRPAPPVPNS